jgi:hypothetical protein
MYIKEINYFNILRMFPSIIDEKFLNGVNPIHYIDYVENMHHQIKSDKKPLIRIDKIKLTNAICKCIKTNEEKFDIFRGYLRIVINDDIFFFIKPNKGLLNFERNTLKELEGEFTILEMSHQNYYNFDEKEIKNLKRDLLIEKYLDEN